MFVTAFFVVFGLGGVVVEHYFGGGGTGTSTTAVKLPPQPAAPAGPQLNASIDSFMGLKEIGSAQAVPFTLHDQSGRKWSLAGQSDKVVVLTFLNVGCNDVCPVESAEIRQAQVMLGAASSRVEFVIVNSDPKHTNVVANPLVLSMTHLGDLKTVKVLTGSLNDLNAVWTAYGLAVTVGGQPARVAHNNLMYFIAPSGQLHSLAVPFGNEDRSGVFSLAKTDIHRFAKGIASVAISLTR
jgi:cytochrome oxidase Cu insertion factor (SCO1/SenC/PrrC family)